MLAGASVILKVSSVSGTEVRTLALPTIFDFDLSNSVTKMWNAKVYPLSIMIAVFSGGWPCAPYPYYRAH